jgi:hypothetical protein
MRGKIQTRAYTSAYTVNVTIYANSIYEGLINHKETYFYYFIILKVHFFLLDIVISSGNKVGKLGRHCQWSLRELSKLSNYDFNGECLRHAL